MRSGFTNALNTYLAFEVPFMLQSTRTSASNDVFVAPIPISVQSRLFHDTTDRETRIESPTASDWTLSLSRRMVDMFIALLVLAVLGVPMLAVALCVCLSSPGPAFFSQYRVGRGGRLFRIYKFRTMSSGAEVNGPCLTRNGDSRINGMGRWLRKLKLDELPQFYNVLRGDMSVVGPRPKLPQYAGIVNMPYRPGITGAATLSFRHEEEILSRVHPSRLYDFYNQHIRPLKARMDVRYMCRATFRSDVRLVGATLLACLTPATTPAVFRRASTQTMALRPIEYRATVGD
jgi:lipopolysaccharide/colanic/teichoic acid biosynthesis glycosyltransferase